MKTAQGARARRAGKAVAPELAPLDGERRREHILRVAAHLFRTKGYKGTSMRDIAEVVGLTKSSLYHHIRGKQDLLLEILQHTVDRAIRRLERIARSSLSPSERLRLAVENHIVHLIEDLDNVVCFIEEGKNLAPDRMRAYVQQRDRYERFFREIVQEGIQAGEFRLTDVRLAGWAILGMCNWVARWYRRDGPYTAQEIATHFGEFAVRALSRGYPLPWPPGQAGEAQRDGPAP
ncbi:MAG: TetR/AcrR family transcriptional regulator [Armatimonadota bacterium]|nr:TetR/AcrR family transcriptional regulator [Armatimonadota bacterium]MDR5688591.1 TetR/AcrR family transcriptional regulator [Armatimonadota bacterium]MDR7386688.1 TetR/AcrR family transcriptional regulator [Armatimonadota bacterium]MDR7389855.1 TetR/AcrR family transcriptional regulator [Armatimonadota bacterium]MDR7391056.1 TetR/AcrR family transcriptional regulator [Armatimonadota bacterium]